jgi:hypothetical protein
LNVIIVFTSNFHEQLSCLNFPKTPICLTPEGDER